MHISDGSSFPEVGFVNVQKGNSALCKAVTVESSNISPSEKNRKECCVWVHVRLTQVFESRTFKRRHPTVPLVCQTHPHPLRPRNPGRENWVSEPHCFFDGSLSQSCLPEFILNILFVV